MVAFLSGAVLTAANLNSAFNALTFRAVTGTSDTFVLADNGGAVSYSNASPITATVPPFSSVAYANGTTIQLLNLGAGVVTVTAGVGVTLNGLSVTLAQNAGGTLIKTATNTWTFVTSGGSPSSASATVATSQSTSSTSYTDLATAGPAVTLVTGTKALVIFTCNLVQGSNNGYAYASFAISGATTQAASDAYSLLSGPATASVQGPTIRASTAQIFTGLTAGSNTFTVKYRTNINVSYFQDRNITVIDMGS